MHKTIRALLLNILLAITANVSFAQHPGTEATVNQILNQQNINRQMDMPGQMSVLDPGNYIINSTYAFNVIFKDSLKTKTIKSKIYTDTILRANYLLFIDKTVPKKDPDRIQKIFPSQTVSISRTSFKGDIKGIAKDTCWMFLVESGPISAYSFLSETADFNEVTIVGIQSGSGPIIDCNAANLKEMIGENSDALKFIEKKKYFKAIQKYNKDIAEQSKNKGPYRGL